MLFITFRDTLSSRLRSKISVLFIEHRVKFSNNYRMGYFQSVAFPEFFEKVPNILKLMSVK